MIIKLLNQEYHALLQKDLDLAKKYADESAILIFEAQILAHQKSEKITSFNTDCIKTKTTAHLDTIGTIENRITAPIWDGKPDWAGTESYAMLENDSSI